MLHYYKIFQSRLLCLFYTENMFMLKQMRKHLKKKVIAIVQQLGHELWSDFDLLKLVKREKVTVDMGGSNNAKGSYYNEMELNQAFASLKDLGI